MSIIIIICISINTTLALIFIGLYFDEKIKYWDMWKQFGIERLRFIIEKSYNIQIKNSLLEFKSDLIKAKEIIGKIPKRDDKGRFIKN